MSAQPYYVAKSPIHGLGVFAARFLEEGEFLGYYEGPQTMKDGTYVLWCEDEDGEFFGIDGKNDLRYLNHSPDPNAVFYGEELVALRGIEPGEEICFHYGEEWDDLQPEESEQESTREQGA